MIIAAGQEADLDYLIITDHNTLRARDRGYEGWHKTLLTAVGEEVSYTREHCLSLGVDARINGRQSPHRYIREIDSQNGISIVVHPHGSYRQLLRKQSYPWESWDVPFTGIELWSYMWDWVKDVRYYNFLWRYMSPDRSIHGPLPETVRMWDTLTQRRRVVAIGGLDAHARRRLSGLFVVFPYLETFRTLLTYIITPTPFQGDRKTDLSLLYQAIRSGHCYLSYEPLQQGKGFAFHARNGNGETAVMGDELPFVPPIDLHITLPIHAAVDVLRNGLVVETFNGRTYTASITAPGVYRVEARLQDRPWLYSNPIYVRACNERSI